MTFSNITFHQYETYDGTLGVTYTPLKTTFRLWAPSAERVQLRLFSKGSDLEPGAKILSTEDMTKDVGGTWFKNLTYDCKNLYYTYLVTIDGITNEVVDIYAKAVGINGNRGMVVDLPSTNPENWEKDKRVTLNNPTDAIIWEIHVKDFSFDKRSGISNDNRGKFLAFTEKNSTLDGNGHIPTCISYLKDLGITHVHLLPIFDQGFLDETNSDAEAFNWGYDPKNYNVPEGSYSSNPYDGNVRIREFKMLVQALHDENIGVIMDVVYNHTAESEKSWFNLTVPGYYYRHKEDGTFSNGSGCGNETASERPMMRKYILDSLTYWMEEYHIDGFRFDLMGLHDVDTMNITTPGGTKKCKIPKINTPGGAVPPLPLIYGEPWCGGPSGLKPPYKAATKENAKDLHPRIACFNDNFRDIIPGRILGPEDKDNKGFIQGAPSMEKQVKAGIMGHVIINNDTLSPKEDYSNTNTDTNLWAMQPSQVITYISAHDNLTFYDKLVLSERNGENYGMHHELLVAENKLAAAMYLTSQGIPFMQGGEEFARSKLGHHNSYNARASLNALDWENTIIFNDLLQYYKGLIKIRKSFSPFRDSTKNSILRMNFIKDLPEKVVAYTLDNVINPKDPWDTVALIFNGNDTCKRVTLVPPKDGTLPKQWIILADKNTAGLEPLGLINGETIEIPGKSAMILAHKKAEP